MNVITIIIYFTVYITGMFYIIPKLTKNKFKDALLSVIFTFLMLFIFLLLYFNKLI